jgi:hypothetical protein
MHSKANLSKILGVKVMLPSAALGGFTDTAQIQVMTHGKATSIDNCDNCWFFMNAATAEWLANTQRWPLLNQFLEISLKKGCEPQQNLVYIITRIWAVPVVTNGASDFTS